MGWLIHNLVVHPLMALFATPEHCPRWLDRLHSKTAMKEQDHE